MRKLQNRKSKETTKDSFSQPCKTHFERARLALKQDSHASQPLEALVLPFAYQGEDALDALRRETFPELSFMNHDGLPGNLAGVLWFWAQVGILDAWNGAEMETHFWQRMGVPDPDVKVAQRQRVWADKLLAKELLPFTNKHPVWSELLANCTVDLVDALAEMIQRLRADRQVLFSKEGADGSLQCTMTPWLSDVHGRQRATARLDFADDATWFYKPRSLGMEIALSSLLSILRERRPDLWPMTMPELIDRDGYGWMAGVPASSLSGDDSENRYFSACGALLALVQTLGGSDFYRDNMICDSHGLPVPIDAELLISDFTKEVRGPESILDTGMLPRQTGATGPLAAGIVTGLTDLAPHEALRRLRYGAGPMIDAYEKSRIWLRDHFGSVFVESNWLESLRGKKHRTLELSTHAYYSVLKCSLRAHNLTSMQCWHEAVRSELSRFSGARVTDQAELSIEDDLRSLTALAIPHKTERLATAKVDLRDGLKKRLAKIDEAWLARECELIRQSLTSLRDPIG